MASPADGPVGIVSTLDVAGALAWGEVKGAGWPMSQLAPAADVLDHRFGESDPLTLGVEEEYMLLDAGMFALVQRVEGILRAEADGDSPSSWRPSCSSRS